MLRASRKVSIMGIVGVKVNTHVVRDGGQEHVAPLRMSDSSKKKLHPMSHDFSMVNGTVLSHLLTSFATVLLVMTISSLYSGRDSTGHDISSAQSETILRKMNFDDNNRLLRRGFSVVRQNTSLSSPFYDVAVVGSGPAGLTASLFAARAGLNVLVIGSETGLLSEATALDNFPSWYDKRLSPKSVASNSLSNGGMTWLATTKLQAVASGVHFVRPGLKVSRITKGHNNIFSLNTSGIIVHSATVIVASGATGRKLNLPNEEGLWGKSIHSCAICDGPSYENKSVVVVGGGDAAVDAAILLSRHACNVVVIHRRESFRASNQRNLRALNAIPKMSVKKPFVVEEYILQDDATSLFGVRIRSTITNEIETLECDGAFIMIGSIPNTQFLRDFVDLDEEGYLETPLVLSDVSTRTSVEGAFAAGEVMDKQYKQAITAAAAGARAAIDAERWLRQQMPDLAGIQRRIPENIPLQLFANDPFPMEREQLKNQAELEGVECIDFMNSDCIKSIVDRHPVVMFSKAECPYCAQALEVLKTEGVVKSALLVINIDRLDRWDEDAIRSTLEGVSGRRTVPNIFIGGRAIGGIVLLSRLQKRGELHAILEMANATQRHVSETVMICDDFRRTECIEAALHKYPVVVFSKSWCPYCKKALEALKLEGVTRPPFILVVNIDEFDAPTIQSNLARITGRRTVPNVFIGGHSIGGGDETMQLHEKGELRNLLVRAKAIAET